MLIIKACLQGDLEDTKNATSIKDLHPFKENSTLCKTIIISAPNCKKQKCAFINIIIITSIINNNWRKKMLYICFLYTLS